MFGLFFFSRSFTYFLLSIAIGKEKEVCYIIVYETFLLLFFFSNGKLFKIRTKDGTFTFRSSEKHPAMLLFILYVINESKILNLSFFEKIYRSEVFWLFSDTKSATPNLERNVDSSFLKPKCVLLAW